MDKRKYILLTIILLFVIIDTSQSLAQCPMCRMAAETNLQNGGTEGKGLNKGILYILSLPYLLVATIGFIWWRNRNKSEEESVS